MSRVLAVLVSVVVHLFTLGFVALGVLLIAATPGFFLTWLIGGFLIAVGVMLRPRLGRVPQETEVLSEASAPALYALAARVAAESGVPRPVVAVHDLGLGATYARVGLRRRAVLTIGLPVWLALSPALRVALLATACAQDRFDEGVIVGGAKATLAEVKVALFGLGGSQTRQRANLEMAMSLGAWAPETSYETASWFGRMVGWVVGWPALVAEVVLIKLTAADTARAEAEVVRAASAVAGTDAITELAEVITSRRYLAPMQAGVLRGEDVASLRRAALDRAAVREIFSGESGAPVVVITESEQIDLELRTHYERAARGLGLLS
ncbi:M48 family metallopeptidase [Herbidospora mongoliensis]|uniref:M48 family metallopeptidase n=1 Tax=Herbidospora mongoliensis TaxID=688067 RepID=UPI00082F9FBC|nr:M48 family metallopeptidase [Herbidospora mongoliensis]